MAGRNVIVLKLRPRASFMRRWTLKKVLASMTDIQWFMWDSRRFVHYQESAAIDRGQSLYQHRSVSRHKTAIRVAVTRRPRRSFASTIAALTIGLVARINFLKYNHIYASHHYLRQLIHQRQNTQRLRLNTEDLLKTPTKVGLSEEQ